MNYKIMGYGHCSAPLKPISGFGYIGEARGERAESDARDIAEACAMRWIGQWFGVVAPDGTAEPPFRYTRQVWEKQL